MKKKEVLIKGSGKKMNESNTLFLSEIKGVAMFLACVHDISSFYGYSLGMLSDHACGSHQGGEEGF